MQALELGIAALFLPALRAGTITVALCNMGGLSVSAIERAKSETAYLFERMGVDVRWTGCANSDDSTGRPGKTWFLVRLRSDDPPRTAGPASLHSMGRAYLGNAGESYMADAYFGAVRKMARRRDTDAGPLLGFVIAHELGHLLLGPGHQRLGIMQSFWDDRDLDDVRQRRLRFTSSEAREIRRRTACDF